MSYEVLTEDELSKISATASRHTMIAWLEAQKIPYLVARSGWPRVHVKAMENALGVAPPPPEMNDISFETLR